MAKEMASKDPDQEELQDEPKQKDDAGQDAAEDIEKRLVNLEKLLEKTTLTLESERRASAGKDKKITDLQAETKKLQEATLSKDDLLRLREDELNRERNEWEREREEEKKEITRLRQEQMRHDVLGKLENFPRFLYDRVKGETPEEVERDARLIMKEWVTDRDKVSNARKVGKKPQSGDGKQSGITAQDVLDMSPDQRREWAMTASEEEQDAIDEELSKL